MYDRNHDKKVSYRKQISHQHLYHRNLGSVPGACSTLKITHIVLFHRAKFGRCVSYRDDVCRR